MHTKIFLDSGNPKDTKEVIDLLGFLDGQTTNPSLVAKNPEIVAKLEKGKKLSRNELLEEYKKIVTEISNQIPNGSISIEVYADENTKAYEMVREGIKMSEWIPNAHIKIPVTLEGLKAAKELVGLGIKVNITLVFTQEQAAAVYIATRGGENTYVSPFIGRLNDIGLNGLDLISNIKKMFETSDHHVKLLAASVRNIDQFLFLLNLGVDIMTAPFAILKQWAEMGKSRLENQSIDNEKFKKDRENLKEIQYKELDLNKDFTEFDILNELTTKGIQKFCEDWNKLIS